jgi:hypothetical protein
MWRVGLADNDTGRGAEVDKHGGLVVTQAGHPPTDGHQVSKVFRQFFTDTGESDGDSDMSVDGSVTNLDFRVQSTPLRDRYITAISLIVAYGTSGNPFEWADGSALSNGVRLFYSSPDGEVDIHDSIKSNQDMFRLERTPVSTSWEVRHVNALNDYGYFININLLEMMPPWGVPLITESDDKLVFRIKDNVSTDADTFNAIAYGFSVEK